MNVQRRHRESFRQLRCFIAHTRHIHAIPVSALPSNAFVAFSTSGNDVNPRDSSSEAAGLPIAVKDTICTKDMKTTCSSAILRDFQPPIDATVVSLLRQAGANIVGKTNCDEFGMGSHNIHSIHGPVVNPFLPKARAQDGRGRSAGGSSGGSAAAVASNACFAALSTDTGGSTRLPAAYCGVSGLKPSYGLLSRWGVVSFADSLDCVGIIAKKSSDVDSVFDVIAQFDSKDPSSAPVSSRAVSDENTEGLKKVVAEGLRGLKIGIPKEYFPTELEYSTLQPFRSLLRKLRSSGADVVPVSLPSTQYALSAYYVIASAEASSNMARYTGIHYGSRVKPPLEADKGKASEIYARTRTKGFGHEVQKRILLGTYALTADAFDNYFLQAQRVRQLVKEDFNSVFRHHNVLSSRRCTAKEHGVDFLLHPSATGTAPLLSKTKEMSELEAYVQDVLTVPTSLAGLPALSIPIGVANDGWPVGACIVGQWGMDRAILKAGEQIERLVTASADL